MFFYEWKESSACQVIKGPLFPTPAVEDATIIMLSNLTNPWPLQTRPRHSFTQALLQHCNQQHKQWLLCTLPTSLLRSTFFGYFGGLKLKSNSFVKHVLTSSAGGHPFSHLASRFHTIHTIDPHRYPIEEEVSSSQLLLWYPAHPVMSFPCIAWRHSANIGRVTTSPGGLKKDLREKVSQPSVKVNIDTQPRLNCEKEEWSRTYKGFCSFHNS